MASEPFVPSITETGTEAETEAVGRAFGETLLDRVCGYDSVGETNIVDVYVRHLRAKLDEVYGVKMLETVRGAGYVIRSE